MKKKKSSKYEYFWGQKQNHPVDQIQNLPEANLIKSAL